MTHDQPSAITASLLWRRWSRKADAQRCPVSLDARVEPVLLRDAEVLAEGGSFVVGVEENTLLEDGDDLVDELHRSHRPSDIHERAHGREW